MRSRSRDGLVITLATLGLMLAAVTTRAEKEMPQTVGPLADAALATLLRPGTTVRLAWSSAGEKRDRDVEGMLVAVDEGALQIREDGRIVTVSRQTIRRLEVAQGRGHDWKWLAIGTGAGVVLGAILVVADAVAGGCTFTSCADNRTEAEADRGIRTRMGIGVAAGMAAGVAISISRHRPTGWTDVSRRQVRLGVTPVVERRAYGLALTVAF